MNAQLHFVLFGKVHLLTLGVLAAAGVVLIAAARLRDAAQRDFLARAFAIFMIAQELLLRLIFCH